MHWSSRECRQSGDISIQNSGSLKLLDKFTYLDSSVPSTESDISMHLVKAWIASDRLSIFRKSDLSDKKKGISSKQWLHQYYFTDASHRRRQNVLRKSWKGTAQEYYELY